MAISFVNVGVSTTGTGSLTLTQTATMPASFIAGDVLICFVDRINDYALTSSTPTGWTFLRNISDVGTSPAAAQTDIYYRIAAGGDAAPTFTVGTTTRFTIQVVAYRGVEPSTLLFFEGGTTEAGSSATTVHSGPTLSNSDATAWAVFHYCSRQIATPASATAGTGLTERVDTDMGVATTANGVSQLADTNGVAATGSQTYTTTSSAGTAFAATWTGYLAPASGSTAKSGPDTATTGNTGTIAAAVAGPDTASVVDSGRVAIPISGPDTAAVSDTNGLVVRVTGSDTATIGDGGSPQVAYSNIAVSLWAVASSGDLVPLPDYESLTLSPIRNAPGSLSVSYPANGRNFSTLYNNVTNDRDAEVEIWLTGSQGTRLRGYLQESAGDDADEARVWTFSGSFLEQRMAEALVYPQVAPLGNDSQELVMSAATAGTVMGTLLTQAQARGSLTDLTKDFTNTLDSKGVAWPTVVTTKFSPGATYQSVLDTLIALGLCEYSISADHVFHLWGPAGRGVDRTTGPLPVILRRGRNLTSAPRKHSVRDSATAVLVAGSNNLYQTSVSAGALARRGRRVEMSSSANNLTDVGSVTAFATQELQVLSAGLMELTVGLGFLPTEPRPGTVFDVGDWIYVDTLSNLERYRVAQWSMTLSGSGGSNPTGTVVVNDTVTDRMSSLAKRLAALTSGSAVVGTSGPDNGTPNPPTGLSASSVAYLDGAVTKSSVTVGWTAPTTNTNSTSISDLAGFNIRYAYASSPTVWLPGGSATSGSAISGSFVANPGVSISIQVDAYDTVGNTSGWSSSLVHVTAADATAPPAPSTPTVSNYLGVLRVTWDGNTNTSADMLAAAPDFDHVDIHVSTSSGFTPSSGTLFDRFFAAGTQVYTQGTYGTTYYFKLIAIDKNGNSGTASAQGSDAPSQVVSADLFAQCVGTAALQDLAVVTAKIGLLQVNDAQMGNVAVGKLTTGIMTASVTLSGIIRTATSGARSEIDAAGIRLYNSGGTNTVNFNANTGAALVVGEFQTATSGQRMRINPAGTAADHIYIYPSGSGDFANIFTRDAIDGSAAILIDGGALTTVGRGRVGAYKQQAFISYVVGDSSGGTQTGYSETAVVCQNDGYVSAWAQTAINFDLYQGSTFEANGHMQFQWKTGTNPFQPMLATGGAAGQPNAGIKFDSSLVCSTFADGAAFSAFKGTAFTVSSSGSVKTGITDIRAVMTPLDVIKAARSKGYKYITDVDRQGAAAPQRFGPIAEDLPSHLVVMTPSATGVMEPSVSLGEQIGTLWGAFNQLLDQALVNVTATVTPPLLATINTDVDVVVPWDVGPAQTVPAVVSIVPFGPGPLQQRSITARVIAKDVNGVTVRFRTKRALTGVTALDPEDRYVVNAIFQYTAPWV